MKRTYQPKKRKRARTHGFRARMSTRAGRLVLKRRRDKGRKRLTVVTTVAPRAPRRRRLSRSAEFERVYRQGRSKGNRFLVLYAFPREEDDADEAARAWACPSRAASAAPSSATASSACCARRSGRRPSGCPAARTTSSSRARTRAISPRARAWTACARRSPNSSTGSGARREAAVRSSRSAATSAGSRRRSRAAASTTRPARSTRYRRSGRYGILKGTVLAAWRILRCNPFSHGGYDPVSAQTLFRRHTHSQCYFARQDSDHPAADRFLPRDPAVHPRQRGARLGLLDHRADDPRARVPAAADVQAVPLDAAARAPAARDEEGAGALQGRQGADEPGDDEVLSGEQGEPVRLVPPDGRAVPGLHRAVLHAADRPPVRHLPGDQPGDVEQPEPCGATDGVVVPVHQRSDGQGHRHGSGRS